MPKGDLWTHEELLLVLNLYHKIPFGQFDHRTPKVIELAKLIGRTSNAVAMQLNNFVALDPYHQNRGIKGLRPPGELARKLWAEAQNDWVNIVLESETILENLTQPDTVKIQQTSAEKPPTLLKQPEGPTETERLTKIRLGQRFFRESIMANYHQRCCICGIPIPELLIASHIIPWTDREDLRLNLCNGLCLCALHDRAFDRGFLTIDAGYTVVISPMVDRYMPQEGVDRGLMVYKARPISLPDRFLPDKSFLEVHQNEYFITGK
ncbi:MAG: HNH endonuclease [Anaerolineae bacterium]|nr:HNH endonuclease [Anaerolineae bacterium]